MKVPRHPVLSPPAARPPRLWPALLAGMAIVALGLAVGLLIATTQPGA